MGPRGEHGLLFTLVGKGDYFITVNHSGQTYSFSAGKEKNCFFFKSRDELMTNDDESYKHGKLNSPNIAE